MRDGDAGQQLPELLVVADRKQHVAGDDARLLVVPGSVPGELQNLVTKGSTANQHLRNNTPLPDQVEAKHTV